MAIILFLRSGPSLVKLPESETQTKEIEMDTKKIFLTDGLKHSIPLFVLGIELKGKFKAYHSAALKIGETKDTFGGEQIIIQKSPEGIVRMFKGQERDPLAYIGGFWFSWLAAHPDTDLFK